MPLDYLAENDEEFHGKVMQKKSTGDNVWTLATDEDGHPIVRVKLYLR